MPTALQSSAGCEHDKICTVKSIETQNCRRVLTWNGPSFVVAIRSTFSHTCIICLSINCLTIFASITAGLQFSTSTIGTGMLFTLVPLSTLLLKYCDQNLATRSRLGISYATFVACVLFCSWLPVKALDRKIPPVEFNGISLEEVCSSFSGEIWIPMRYRSLSEETLSRMISFRTTQWMTRRDVANKLAGEQGLVFREGYCGTGATILWGSAPSFCSLAEP